MTIRLVATDVDDTLMSSDMQVPQGTREMIKRMQQAGIIVTIATGRMHYSAARVAKDLGIDAPVISYNGAMIRKGLNGEILHLTPRTQEQVIWYGAWSFPEELGCIFILTIRFMYAPCIR